MPSKRLWSPVLTHVACQEGARELLEAGSQPLGGAGSSTPSPVVSDSRQSSECISTRLAATSQIRGVRREDTADMKKVAVTLVSLVALAMAAPAASAGEYTGSNNPKAGKAMGGEKAASICAYSGLDAPDDIEN